MAGLKKSLDKFDLGTPMLAGLLGGTADYGEAADEQEDQVEAREKVAEAASYKKRPVRKQSRRAAATALS